MDQKKQTGEEKTEIPPHALKSIKSLLCMLLVVWESMMSEEGWANHSCQHFLMAKRGEPDYECCCLGATSDGQ